MVVRHDLCPGSVVSDGLVEHSDLLLDSNSSAFVVAARERHVIRRVLVECRCPCRDISVLIAKEAQSLCCLDKLNRHDVAAAADDDDDDDDADDVDASSNPDEVHGTRLDRIFDRSSSSQELGRQCRPGIEDDPEERNDHPDC